MNRRYLSRIIWIVLFSGVILTLISATTMLKSDENPTCTSASIRATIHSWKERMEKDTEQFPEILNEFVRQTDECTDPAMKALMHSMIAEMYKRYYNNNQWDINQRTNIEGEAPADIRVWSRNLFDTTIANEIKRSLSQEELLRQAPVETYKELLTREKGGYPIEFDSLYDFLMWRMTDIAYDEALVESWLSNLKDSPNKDRSEESIRQYWI